MNYVAYLIDNGNYYKNPNLIKKGILRGKELLNNKNRIDTQKRRCKLLYYIGNGYSILYGLNFNKYNGFQQMLNNKYLLNAKNFYRKAIVESGTSTKSLKRRLLTNYANCLDDMVRGVDALFIYEEALRVDPTFSMSLLNKAIAIKRFADISGKYRGAIYNNAYKILNSIKDNEDLIQNGGINARKRVISEIDDITKKIDKKILSKDLSHEKYNLCDKNSFERFYIEFCSKNDLFLNFHLHDKKCEASIGDPIFMNLLLPQGDKETFYNLSKPINQIKEDYGIARLLLVQSLFQREDLNNISNLTNYVNTPDRVMFNIYGGLLKSAFKDAYNVLDKIAGFINDYFCLSLKGNIYFTKKELWEDNIGTKKRNKWKIKLEIIESNNSSLYALYDINMDFNKPDKNNPNDLSGYYYDLREIRNKLVHEKLIIHEDEWEGTEDIYNLKYNTMLSKTIKLLKIVKSAIIYLINSIQINEQRKEKTLLLPTKRVAISQSFNFFQ